MSPLPIPSAENPAASARVRRCNCPYVTGAGVTIAGRSGISRAHRSSQSVSVASTALSFHRGERDLCAGEAAEEIEHPLAPCSQRIVRLEHWECAHDARPLEQAE